MGKFPLAFTERRNRAFRLSIEFVLGMKWLALRPVHGPGSSLRGIGFGAFGGIS